MPNSQSFRYSWLKVTDESGRKAQMQAALAVQQELLDRRRAVQPGSSEARTLSTQLAMARHYLGGDLDHTTRVIVVPPAADSLSIDLLLVPDHSLSRAKIEIAMATMPAQYSREEAMSWLKTPVGSAWARDALACRLSYAVVSDDQVASMLAPRDVSQEA